jgi:glycosyltransferase involved in cell wall biosynthesis
MTIFHGLHNIAGIPGTLSSAEKKMGLASRAICYAGGFDISMIDEVVTGDSFDLLRRCIEEFNIFNFHFGYSILNQSLRDLPLLRRLNRQILMHFHGCDIRDSKIVQERYPISACAECWPFACNANRKQARAAALEFANVITVSTPDLLEFVPGAIWMPQAVEIDAITQTAYGSDIAVDEERIPGSLRIVHAPSAARLKGTRFIQDAIERLRARGLDIEFLLLTDMPHGTVLKELRKADIVIDQMLIGAYGVFAVEAMALGKPTICYIREDLLSKYPAELPIVNASIADLDRCILELVERSETWFEIAQKSRAYAYAYHDAAVVARDLAMCYV